MTAVSSSAERDEIKRLRSALQRVEMERDILKKSRDHLLPTASFMSGYAFVISCPKPWPVTTICRVLAVSTSGYYQWLQVKPAPAPVPGKSRPRPPTRATPGVRVPAACGPKATPWAATPCVLGCGPAGAQHPRPTPAHGPGRPGGRGGRKPAAGPARALGP